MDVDLYQISALLVGISAFVASIGWTVSKVAPIDKTQYEQNHNTSIVKTPMPKQTGLSTRLNELDSAVFSPSMQPIARKKQDTWPFYNTPKVIGGTSKSRAILDDKEKK